MSSSNTFNFNYSSYSAFSQLKQQKISRLVAGLLFMMVVGLHLILALYLLNAPKTEHKRPPLVVELKMITQPEPIAKQVAKEPPIAPPPAKKESKKPKAVIKPPKPIKKTVVVKKPVPVPKPTPTEINKVIPIPKFEPVPIFKPAPPVVAQAPATVSSASSNSSAKAKTAETSGHGHDSSNTVVSGVVPLVRVPPKYPARAASRQIEGWVKVEFTIQTDGSVINAVVVRSEPETIFDDAALTAIRKWKFKEKMVNGVAVRQRAVQKLQFKLKH